MSTTRNTITQQNNPIIIFLATILRPVHSFREILVFLSHFFANVSAFTAIIQKKLRKSSALLDPSLLESLDSIPSNY